MVRIAGVNIPKDKNIYIALTYIYGIGPTTSKKILQDVKINPNKRVEKLTDDEVANLISIVRKYKLEGDLKREKQLDLKRLMEINCYTGYRHRRGLPVRGQRTKTNARTRKGRKMTIANKKKETK